jgi:tetratricopeptide (TPR) repeat protein
MNTGQSEAGEGAEQAERLLLEARLWVRRGQPEEAIARCQQALELDPRAWQAHDMMGDILADQGRAQEALARYRQAQAIVPGQADVEEKIARAILAQAERDRLGTEGPQVEALSAEAPGPPRNPSIAALLSLVLPGLGQGYNRQLTKGAIVLGLVIVLTLMFMFQLGAQVSRVAEGGAGGTLFDYFEAVFTPAALAWLVLLIVAWFYGIIDAALVAGRRSSERRGII